MARSAKCPSDAKDALLILIANVCVCVCMSKLWANDVSALCMPLAYPRSTADGAARFVHPKPTISMELTAATCIAFPIMP